MTQYIPTDNWTDASINIPGYGVIEKSHVLELGGNVEAYLLTNGFVRRLKSSDTIPAEDPAIVIPGNAKSINTPNRKSGQQSHSGNQEPPTE